jgi:hypothetical protein
MYDPLGLSIGTGNLVATRNGDSPVTRRSVLTLFPHRSPEVGLPEENSDLTESGAVTTGFVECIGGATASLCPGDLPQDPELLLVEALDAMVSAAGGDAASSKLTIAVPAYWGPDALRSLRKGLRTHSGFVHSGIAPRLVSDALAALTAINSASGLPDKGVVGLLDFGAGGTSITLADAASDFEPIDKTLRYPEFSGNHIDETVLVHVADATGQQRTLDSATTAAVGPLAQLREECRKAKERLSIEPATEVVVDSANDRLSVQLTRAELEDLITDRLDGVLSAFDQLLTQHKIESRDLAAVVAVGGGASIPLVSQRLSSHTQVPVITAMQPAFSAAVGAALFASREPAVVEETTAATATATATAMAAAFAGTSTGISGLPPADLLLDDEPPSTPRKLAWSEDDGTGMEPVPYSDDTYGGGPTVRPARFGPEYEPPEDEPRGRYHVPRLILGLTALAAMVAIGGVAYNLTSAVQPQPPAPPASPTMAPPAPPPTSLAPSLSPLPPPPSVLPSASPEPPPPPPSAEPPPPPEPPPAPPPPPVMTTYQPPPPAKTTQPTTTAAPTTTTTTTTAPSEPPPDTPADTSSSVPMTTEYLTLPLVPVPIPIKVPQSAVPAAPQYPNQVQPQNPYVNPPGYGGLPQNPYPQNPYGGYSPGY